MHIGEHHGATSTIYWIIAVVTLGEYNSLRCTLALLLRDPGYSAEGNRNHIFPTEVE